MIRVSDSPPYDIMLHAQDKRSCHTAYVDALFLKEREGGSSCSLSRSLKYKNIYVVLGASFEGIGKTPIFGLHA